MSLKLKSLIRFNSSKILARFYSSSIIEENFYSQAEKDIQNDTRKIIEKEIAPFVDEWESNEKFPGHQLFKILGDAKLLGINRPIENGGLGKSFKSQAAYLEELGSINCVGIPGAIAVQCISTLSLSLFANSELKEEFLKPTIQGDIIGCNGVSEPKGSEKTRAVRKDDDLIINGQKMWITNGMQADWMCLSAETSYDPAKRRGKNSLICLPLKADGVHRKRVKTMGMKSSDTALITLENVKIPAKFIIGEEGSGFRYLLAQFQEARLAEGVLLSLKALDNAINLTIEKTRNSTRKNKPILDNQVVHFRIAELATEIEILRSLVYKVVELYENEQNINLLASMVKVKSGRLLREVSDSCFQFFGAMGYIEDSHIARIYRDFRLGSIAGGSDEMMLNMICRSMGILPKA